jgi:hypothetical protein
MANPYGRMIECSVVISPDKRGKIVVNAKGRQAERQIQRRGWTNDGNQWLAPEGWSDTTTVIYNPNFPPQGRLLNGYRFHDLNSERNVVICTTSQRPADLKRAEATIRKMAWRKIKGQWVAP